MPTRQFRASKALSATILIRVMVGWVFMSEGIQKFLVTWQSLSRFKLFQLPFRFDLTRWKS